MPCIIASMHPSLKEKERQQKTEMRTPQQKVSCRSTVLHQSQLQTCPFHHSEKVGGYHQVRVKIIAICILKSVLIIK